MRIVFIHIPRTAGNSIVDAVVPPKNAVLITHDLRDPQHRYYHEIAWPGDRVVAFVRHPLHRLFSAFTYLKKGGNNPADAGDADALMLRSLSFEEFAVSKLKEASQWQIHFLPQLHWLRGAKNPDIYKFEDLPGSFLKFCEKYGIEHKELSHLNASHAGKHLELLQNARVIRITEEIYREDYSAFGY